MLLSQYLCFQLVSYQYILGENMQIAPDAVPVGDQPLLNLVLVEPWDPSFTRGLRRASQGVHSHEMETTAVEKLFLCETSSG